MRYKQFAILLSVVSFLGGCGATSAQTMRPQLPHHRPVGFWENEKAVVQVIHVFSQLVLDEKGKPVLDANGKFTTKQQMNIGTAPVVDANGLVVTNKHIVNEECPILEEHPITEECPINVAPDQLAAPLPPEIYMVCTVHAGVRDCDKAEVVAIDPQHDLAQLHTNRHFSHTVKFVDDSELLTGDEIYLWGNVFSFLPPSSLFGRYIGRVEPPYYTDENFSSMLPLLLMDMNISPGSSGGPVFDELGRCIGMAYGYTKPSMGGRSLGIIIPSSTINKFRKENPYPPSK